ncbi:MAG: DUF4215 domain-containing protein [Nitrospirota bacterium]
MKRRLTAFAAMVGMFALVGGCTLNPNGECTGSDCSDLSIIPGDIKVPCDPGDDGVTDCVLPNECQDAGNTAPCACLDAIGETCIEWDPTCVCAVPPVPACGDGTLDVGEVCDDGNIAGGDGCSADCLSDETCGNGILDALAGEACDDGNVVAGDGCSDLCQLEACGNGVLDSGEVCDDGNVVDGDGCSANCLSDETCGNGTLDPGEVCDDGNVVAGDGCSADCLSLEVCGNGITELAEVCDDGNVVDGDGCSANCLSDETCGNGILDPGEVCDDGNIVDGDGCAGDCLSNETCGNGTLDLTEVCDDGNNLDGDGCSADCLSLEVCGNGILDLGETCDDGNVIAGDGCDDLCLVELCGNAVIDPGEMCDSGLDCDPVTCACPADYAPDGGLGCLACGVAGTCASPYCVNAPVCWVQSVRVALPSGGTIHIETGAGVYVPVVVPAGQWREIGLVASDLGADFWCSTPDISVEATLGTMNAWFPGVAYPLPFAGPGLWVLEFNWSNEPGSHANFQLQ